jgi:hypothetical protein
MNTMGLNCSPTEQYCAKSLHLWVCAFGGVVNNINNTACLHSGLERFAKDVSEGLRKPAPKYSAGECQSDHLYEVNLSLREAKADEPVVSSPVRAPPCETDRVLTSSGVGHLCQGGPPLGAVQAIRSMQQFPAPYYLVTFWPPDDESGIQSS